VRALNVEDLAIVDHLSEAVQEKAWRQPLTSLRDEVWTLQRPAMLNLLRKVRSSGITLKGYIEDEFYIGIKTGRNRVFIIDNTTREELIDADPKSAEVIKPWLRGRNVKRWQIDSDAEYVIALHSSTDQNAKTPWGKFEEEEAEAVFEATYPVVYRYMKQHEKSLRKRSDQGKFWWELRSCTYYHIFAEPKIVWPDIAKRCEFTLDDSGAYPDMTLFAIPTNDLYLLGILNSRVVEWFILNTSSQIQQGFLRFKRVYMRQVPIPTPTEAQRDAIETLVRQLLNVEGEGPQAEAWERALNAHVYAVYDLTPAEIALIEEATADGA
jgi:hypothetical protein